MRFYIFSYDEQLTCEISSLLKTTVTVRWSEEVDFLETDWNKLFRFEVKGPRKVRFYLKELEFNNKNEDIIDGDIKNLFKINYSFIVSWNSPNIHSLAFRSNIKSFIDILWYNLDISFY